jgi:hypothetical protein
METAACSWCTKHRPLWRVHRLASNQVICDYCLEWHYRALDFLGGAPPAGCQVCEKSWQLLSDSTPGAVVRLYVVPKDGYLQLMCAACVAPYLPKQKQLYKGTRFGAEALKTS